MILKSPLAAGKIRKANRQDPLKQRNTETRAVVSLLKKAFPHAKVDAYRYSPVSIRLRVIDSRFRKMKGFDRIDVVSDVLESLPKVTRSHIMDIVPITPDEHRDKVWSLDYDFDHPLPYDG